MSTLNYQAQSVRIGLVQHRCSQDASANLERAVLGIEEAVDRGASLVCLQELFSLPYFCQNEDIANFDLAESIPGPTTERLAGVAAASCVDLVVPLFERRGAGLFHNAVVLIDSDGHISGQYRKMHIPDDPRYYEKFYFSPGDLGFPVVQMRDIRISPLICWDQWFPEAARLSTLGGAEMLVYPTAIGWRKEDVPQRGSDELEAWQMVQRGHAIANGVYVLAVNRVGEEGGLRFWGSSFVADPFGRILGQASAQEEEVLIVDCDLSRLERVRRHWPFLRDRRPDAYQDLIRRFRS